jgi:predicted enzyme related to lactoylglutathione lyase
MKPSKNIALQTEDAAKALIFYQQILGLKLADGSSDTLCLGSMNLIVDQATDLRGPVFEFVVEDLEAVRRQLERAGCKVIRWEGKGGCCFIEDPFGLRFNLWQD